MQNFKTERAPWKDTEVNSMRSRQAKGRGPSIRQLTYTTLYCASISFSKGKKIKSMKNILRLTANCCNNLLKQIIGK